MILLHLTTTSRRNFSNTVQHPHLQAEQSLFAHHAAVLETQKWRGEVVYQPAEWYDTAQTKMEGWERGRYLDCLGRGCVCHREETEEAAYASRGLGREGAGRYGGERCEGVVGARDGGETRSGRIFPTVRRATKTWTKPHGLSHG